MARFTTAGGSGSGAPGPQGPAGDSAYDIAVENGFVGTEQEWLDSIGGGGTANIADFIFTDNGGDSTITLPGDKEMRIHAGEDSDLYLTAGDDLYIQTLGAGDDIHLNAADDIRFTTNNENYEYETVHNWRMNSEGRLQLPGYGYIENPPSSSGDGYNNATIKLVPDTDNTGSDQHIVIDPTAPNHIHIRAGGAQDYSSAELILGGERAGVHVSDSSGNVGIQSKKEDYSWSYENINPETSTTYIVATEVAEPDYNDFTIDNGVKYVINNVIRNAQSNTTQYTAVAGNGTQLVFNPGWNYLFNRDNGIYTWSFDAIDDKPIIILPPEEPVIANLAVPGDITLSAYNGIKIAASSGFGIEFPDQTIQTTAYIPGAGVNGEVTRWTPNFTATGLTFTGSGATHPTYNSHYVKNGRMVSFNIEVDLSTVTNFGTGQYKLQLPFTPQFGFNHFSGWIWADPNVSPDVGTGHTILNADTAGVTDVLDLHYLKQSGGANSPIREGLFLQGTPVTLSTISKIYINGTYITAE